MLDNLEAKEKEVTEKIQEEEKEKAKKEIANKKLQDEKRDLKEKYRKMELQMRELENQLNNKTAEATKVASRKIILEEEIYDLEGKISFEQQHFKLMEEALRFGPPGEVEENKKPGDSKKPSSDNQNFLEDILKDYAKQFGDEYERLMRKHQIREKALLTARLNKIVKKNDEKKTEVDELSNKLKKLGIEIIENEKELEKLRKELAALEETKTKDQSEYENAKKLKEMLIEKLEKENDNLRIRIDATQKSANEALKVIIELEFEIKTYERLLRLEQENGNLSILKGEEEEKDQNAEDTIDIPLSEITAQSAGLAGKLSSSSNSSSYSSSDEESNKNANNKSNRSKASRKSSKKSNSREDVGERNKSSTPIDFLEK